MEDMYDDKFRESLDIPVPVKKRGRPAKHVNAAARQKAYRERKKLEGMREIKHWVKDVRDDEQMLTSNIIDLSEVRACRFTRLRQH